MEEQIERAGLIESKRFSFVSTNLDELEKLLRTAVKQTEQLQQTLNEIQQFRLNTRSQVDE